MEYKNTLIEFFSEREGFKKHMLCLEAEVTVQTAAPEPGMCIHSFVQPGIPQWQWLRITGQKTQLLLEDAEVKALLILSPTSSWGD